MSITAPVSPELLNTLVTFFSKQPYNFVGEPKRRLYAFNNGEYGHDYIVQRKAEFPFYLLINPFGVEVTIPKITGMKGMTRYGKSDYKTHFMQKDFNEPIEFEHGRVTWSEDRAGIGKLFEKDDRFFRYLKDHYDFCFNVYNAYMNTPGPIRNKNFAAAQCIPEMSRTDLLGLKVKAAMDISDDKIQPEEWGYIL